MQEEVSQVRSTVMVSLITAFCLLGDSMLYIVLPLYWKDFGLTELWQIGVLLAVNRFARLPLNPLVIWLYARLGRRKCLVLAIFVALFTTLSYSFLQGFMLLFLARCIWGGAWALLRLGAYFSIMEFSSLKDRGLHMGLYNGVFRLGSLFGMLGGALVAEFLNPLAGGYLFSLFAVLALPLAYKYVPDTPYQGTGQKLLDSVNVIFSSKLIGFLALTSFLSALVYQGIFTSMLSYLTGYNEISLPLLLSLGFGAASLSGLLQAVRWLWEPFLAPKIGQLSDGVLGRSALLIIFSVSAGLMLLVISYKIDTYFWLFLILLIQFAGTGITTLADAMAADVAGANKNAATILGAHSFCIDLGSAIGPLLGYYLISLAGIHAPFFLAGGCLLTISALWLGNKQATIR